MGSSGTSVKLQRDLQSEDARLDTSTDNIMCVVVVFLSLIHISTPSRIDETLQWHWHDGPPFRLAKLGSYFINEASKRKFEFLSNNTRQVFKYIWVLHLQRWQLSSFCLTLTHLRAGELRHIQGSFDSTLSRPLSHRIHKLASTLPSARRRQV